MSDFEARRRVMLGALEEVISDRESAPPGFEVLQELDRGGMAVVYLARQLKPDREIALKVMLPRFAGVEEMGIRFQREGRAMAALEHPGVLPVYQVGEWDGMAFLAMKLARGGNLQERLAEGLPNIREAVDWLIEVGEAVHFAHQRGVLHRDLKPGNLLFDEDGSIYVGDFGVAKLEFAEDGGLTRTEALVGTPNYLAPEVASGEATSGSVAADLYGLGAVLYECLTGRRPHDGADNLAAQLRCVVEEPVIPARKIRPEVSRDLGVICEKALAKNPLERYGSVAGFVEDLERWRDGRGILARPASVPEKVLRWSKRHPLPAALTALLVVTIMVATALQVEKAAQLAENYQRQGELVQELLLKGAKAERLLREPGFRKRGLDLLQKARESGESEKIREEATAILRNWDIGSKLDEFEGKGVEQGDVSIRLEVIEEGVRVVGDRLGEEGWVLPGGAQRCDPAWSGDRRFLAMVRGERMEVVIYDVFREMEFSRVALKGWPDKLIFDGDGERLKVLFEDRKAMLASVRGDVLLRGFPQEVELLKPVGFTVWKGQMFSSSEANPYGGRLSRDQALLATISVSGVQIWDVVTKRSVEFYETENQRIDAPTDAWWMSDRKLLLQVPGALEILTLNEQGKLIEVSEIEDRKPGARIQKVLANGDWVVEARDEDGLHFREIWLGGDSDRVRDWSQNESSLPRDTAKSAGTVKIGNWVLALPQGDQTGNWVLELPHGEQAQQVFMLEEEARVIVLTKNYAVCEWDLSVLGRELDRLGL